MRLPGKYVHWVHCHNILALAAGSLVKGVSGLGLPLTAIPVMAGYMDVDRAVAIIVLPGVLLNFWLL